MKKFNQTIIVIFAALSVIACGPKTADEKKPDANKKAEVEKVEVEAEKVQEEKVLVEIKVQAIGESMNEMQFEPNSINIPANSRVKLILENKSATAGMLHNFVLVELGSGQEIASAAIKAGKDNDFLPKDKRIFAATTVADLGETVSIEFDAPAKGSYHYICTYPGHYPKMIGRLIVE